MKRTKWLYPLIILVFSIIALVLSFALYIYWYLEVSDGLKAVVRRFELETQQVLEPQTWVVILVLSILVGFILICISTIFIFFQKNLQLYRMQHNFINNFTHELKTPVTSLKLYLETFLKHELSREEQRKYIGYMIQDAGRISDNISRILDLARIEAKSYSQEFAFLDLIDVFEQFFMTNDHLFQNVEVNISNSTNQPLRYSINSSLIEMLLMNLTTNALKYNSSEKPTLDIRFEREKRELHILFEDNGIGIEKAEFKKVFKKFYQVGRSDDMSAIGSGIGLYMVDNIARIHKGKIKAESKGKGKGSVFTLVLPYRT
ncbi:MAG: HAMP domain-containing histidine kinase [Proteobacteria bacterium]|nr:HAMP domain-containing histidine kinase [Pseudomonadota bacterium]